MKTDVIRQRFLDFFRERGATVVPSDSLVPANDPTLLFTGAGMNQFKDQFMGLRIDYRRAASCQKCLRTGDIMNVGVTPSHHTFFEMLGNFSFGDYFKKEAVAWAWEFLTGPLEIAEDRLQVSVHQGDDEAFDAWHNTIGLSPDRIHRLGDHDNFWPADAPKLGPDGPCGPCSEIFFDRGAEFGCGKPTCGITCACRRWVEIWNLVFTQYDRRPDGSLPPLPQKNIDTGSGLERLAACLQGAPTNMDIDIFQPLTARLAELAGKRYGERREDDVLMRRVADHARAVTFCLADGVVPGNVHRGYVLKRLLRRAVLDGRTLGAKGAFLHLLVPVVADVMKAPYPEVLANVAVLEDSVRREEEKFLATLDRGLARLDAAAAEAKAQAAALKLSPTLPGAVAFELYDTYGFPYELAEEAAGREGLEIDRAGFDEALAAARAKAREGAKMKGDVFAKGPLQDIKKLTSATAFTGYGELSSQASVLAVVAGDALADAAEAGTAVTVALDRTPFYGESGGQVGDTGFLYGDGGLVVRIEDTQKLDGIHLHIGTVDGGVLKPGTAVVATVDGDRRADIARHHTATHLLHHALREVLGDLATQKGSHVAADRLRFDYQVNRAPTAEEKRRIEELVNRRILENAPVGAEETTLAEAREAGVTALFGEKYGDRVRVLKAGDFSAELCGGTHAPCTGVLGSFRLVGDEALAAGVRRMEGVVGLEAVRAARRDADTLDSLARALKTPVGEVAARVEALDAEARDARKQLAAQRQASLAAALDAAPTAKVAAKGHTVTLRVADASPAGSKELSELAEAVRKSLGDDAVVVLGTAADGKASVVVASGPGAQKAGVKAGVLVKKLAAMIGGGGGGRPDLAQAGGREPDKLAAMLAAVTAEVEAALGDGGKK